MKDESLFMPSLLGAGREVQRTIVRRSQMAVQPEVARRWAVSKKRATACLQAAFNLLGRSIAAANGACDGGRELVVGGFAREEERLLDRRRKFAGCIHAANRCVAVGAASQRIYL